MSARIIDGKAVAAALRARLAQQVATLPFRPGLAVVLVGDDPASAVYVRTKDRAANAVGIAAHTIRLPADTSEEALITQIARLNADPAVDGILVQLAAARAHRLAGGDRGGRSGQGRGRLPSAECRPPGDRLPGLVPCTPPGVMKLLAEAGIPLEGARALVLGRSAIVGRPMAALLLAAHATVTVAHSRTRDLAAECRRADIIVAAVGKPELVRGDWIAPGATVIDVGVNRLADGRLVGDVAFAEAVGVAGAITPVPGGVGPMTIACLLENTVTAALRRRAEL